MKVIAKIILLSACIYGCSTAPSMSSAELNNAYRQYLNTSAIKAVNKVSAFRFERWQSLTSEFLLIDSRPKKHYLIEVGSVCNELAFAQALIINRSTDSELHSRFDSISTARHPDIKCSLKSIYPLSKDQVNEIKQIGQPAPAENVADSGAIKAD